MMDFKLDVHTHTLVSGHAFSTLGEMIAEAQNKGLEILGVTEHGPNIPGTCDPIYFRNLHVVPRRWGNLRLLLGAELNILNTSGDLDLDESYYKRMDLRIAGIHRLCWQGGTREENTQGMLNAIANPWTHIISHPGDGTAELDFEPLVEASKKHHTLLEVNSTSMRPARGMVQSRENNLTILRLCKQMDVPIILGSDAHIACDITNYEYSLPLLQETDFPERLIMNTQPREFLEYLEIE